MKRILLMTACLLLSMLLHAQNQSKEKAAIEAQIDAMIQSWNNHNYDDLKDYTTEDTDWVNVVGMWWKGRKESQYAHQAFHDTFLKEVVMQKQAVYVRFVTNNVAVAHLFWHYTSWVGPEGKKWGDLDSIATLVFVNQKGKWLMTAGQNTDIVKELQDGDPARAMPRN